MRERDRKSIEIDKMLPQFTTMNVIDGQAGLVIYSSLIFYSLTIDNILNIVVLIILAGVSIATLTGDNGIITKTNEAKKETEQAGDKELIRLAISEARIGENGYQELNTNTLQEAINNQFDGRNAVVSDNDDGTYTVSCLDTLRDYIISGTNIEEGIDWNEAMSNAVAPKSQDEARNEGVIGIGTDGKPVDMDLWEYTLLENDTFGLNDEEALEDVNKTPGYLFGENGENIIDGKIIGTVPQYISIDRGETWKPVSDMTSTFCENDILISAPYIPQTVTKMLNTFIRCINLKSIQNLPQSLVDLGGAFKQTSIEKIMYLPDSIENLGQTFYNCNKITNIPNIPKRLIKMNQAFEGCSLLNNVNILIPETVINMFQAFAGCEALSGRIIIKANINGKLIDATHHDYSGCFARVSLNENAILTLICSKNVFDLFYDDTRPNKIKAGVADYNAKIELRMI